MLSRDHDPEPSASGSKETDRETERSICGGCSGPIIRWLYKDDIWTEWRHE